MIDMKPACSQMSDLLAAVADDQRSRSTPCTDYTVDDLIKHVDEVAQGATAVARGNVNEQGVPGMNAELPRGDAGGRRTVAAHVHGLGEAWADPQAWQGSTDAGGLELTNELWGKIALTEMVVHGWDIARAIGHPIALPEETLQACFDHLVEFVPNAPIPELWGAAVEMPVEASLLDQIVAITGRTP